MNVYAYCSNNPVMMHDPSGTSGGTTEEDKTKNSTDNSATPTASSATPASSINLQTYSDSNGNSAGMFSFKMGENSVSVAYATVNGKTTFALSADIDISSIENFAGELSKAWDAFKVINPVQAGVIGGLGNFLVDTVSGIAHMIAHPIDTIEGLATLVARTSVTGILLDPKGAMEFYTGLWNMAKEGVDKFAKGDTYTKTSMITYGIAFVASFFVGAGEAKAASSAGKVGETMNVMERGIVSGEKYAASIAEGGTGKAFAGHGELRSGAGMVEIPEGTSLTMWGKEGQGIPDGMGKLIEQGNFDDITKLYGFPEGAVTHLPGASIPNWTLKAPDGLNIMSKSVTVEDATKLNVLLQKNMGNMQWAACLKFRF